MTGATRRIRTNSKRGRSGAREGNGEEENDASESAPKIIQEERSTPPLETPRVLTRSSVNILTHGLDASDVIECYALVRSAPLHGIANSTITVQKMTIGIRFRPTTADLKNPYNFKTPMELTLEYGPARLGPLLSDEATPIVQGNDESSSYLAWDNAAKMYYTEKIVTENFLSSHYMASMTGAVLNKLLTEAVEYAEKRKVYQPFSIFSDSGQRLLRSSSSSDFTWFVWTHLAKLGVEIEPILPPAMYETRLYTKSITKVFPDQSVTHAAATFYQRLYNCLESIATNNYGSFLSSKEQSTINDDDNDDNISSAGTTSSNAEDGNNRDLGIGSGDFNEDENSRTANANDQKRLRLEGKVQEIEVPDVVEGETSKDEEEKIVKNSRAHDEPTTTIVHDEESDDIPEDENTIVPEDSSRTSSPTVSIFNSSEITPMASKTTTDAPIEGPTSVGSESLTEGIPDLENAKITPMDSKATTDAPTSAGFETLAPTEGIQDLEKAQKAASNAQKAADEAKIAAQTEGNTKAADAAQAAADAALAAADATSNAASQAAMDSLLSGDGTMMSSIIATCFSNSVYEISSPDTNSTSPIEIYLFRDPSTYYKLELTSPYMEVAKLHRPLPNAAALLSDYGAGGDALDWTLAILIFLSMFLMVLLICQQMGNHYVGSIFKCQRWFFNPSKRDDEGESISGIQSGQHFYFGKSGIPVSMGGKQSSYSPMKNGKTIQNVIVNDDGDRAEQDLTPMSSNVPQGSHHSPTFRRSPSRELEMVNFEPNAHNHNGRPSPRVHTYPYKDNSDSSVGSRDDDETPLEFPDRLLRNPDLVELPSLKSKSKVAMPVGSSTNSSIPYSASSSFGEGSINSGFDRNNSQTIL
jgi:hypothetical protein